MVDWSACPAVERSPEKVSGAWLFKGTRVPVAALFENLEAGASIDQFLEWFPGVQRDQINAVIRHADKEYFTVAEWYDEWAGRRAAGGPPLNEKERAGYLVWDFWIRTAMEAFDTFLDDPSLAQETVDAFRAVGLGAQADVIAGLLSRLPANDEDASSWFVSELASAEPTVDPDDDALLSKAIYEYIHASR
jgi:uncharacterized protein (DUF433 family)